MPAQKKFTLVAPFRPAGDQPKAIAQLVTGIQKNCRRQTLLGVTGSGKTFTMANVIAHINKPTLVLAHNKTLAAQLYNELKEFFPNDCVEYFISYYDYYQPESYLPATDTYIEKDVQINPKIEQMRLSATNALLTATNVIIVASVSCIYALGDPKNYTQMSYEIKKTERMSRNALLKKFIEMQYERNDLELMPGRFRVRGDTIDIIPSGARTPLRIEFFGDKIERISEIGKFDAKKTYSYDTYHLFPARHFATPATIIEAAVADIKKQLALDLPKHNEFEAHRLKSRVNYDLEMIQELGYCKSIENYSRHFDMRKPGEPPYTLLDYFPKDFLFIIDESHRMIPQVQGMYEGDRSRKKALIDFGFRLESAYDNRPLKFSEFEKYLGCTIFVSATPAGYEQKTSEQIVEQIIRPTGLVDPQVAVRKTENQIADLMAEMHAVIANSNRILVTTLTKKLAEELTEYFAAKGFKVRYLHSEIETLQRTELIRKLRRGDFDILVGINLLREGIDIPEVGMVAILDGDKEGFLRDEISLIQTIGRAARNNNSKVIIYADTLTKSIKNAVAETKRRRNIQQEYNQKNNITPRTIVKPIPVPEQEVPLQDVKHIPKTDIPAVLIELEAQMKTLAEALEFEDAISVRDTMRKLSERLGNDDGKRENKKFIS